MFSRKSRFAEDLGVRSMANDDDYLLGRGCFLVVTGTLLGAFAGTIAGMWIMYMCDYTGGRAYGAVIGTGYGLGLGGIGGAVLGCIYGKLTSKNKNESRDTKSTR
jgi:hypothetical protein